MDSEGLAFKFLSERVYLFMLLCISCWKHYLVQKNGKVKEGLFAIKILFRGKSKVQPVIFILQRKINNFPQLFLHEEMFLYFWREICEQTSLIFLLKKLPGETLCKSLQIFPPKVLVYIYEWIFPDTFLTY